MNLRSLTGFVSLTDPLDDSPLRAFAQLARAGRDEFTRAGLPLQTTRVATQSIAAIKPRALTQFALDIQAACKALGIDYVSLGAPRGEEKIAEQIPAAVIATESVFGSAHITHDHTISLDAIQTAARIIHELGRTTPDGFGNLRFAALANCGPHSPFFPAAYHDGTQPAFAIATEGAPLAVEAFTATNNLEQARENLVSAIERECKKIVPIAEGLAKKFSFRFAGIDFSMAPYPDDAHSIGAAMEKLTGAKFGEHGTLFATAFITDCIRRANFPRVGFSGVMLPVLEDSTLGRNSANFTLDSLLLYSTVCGTGLDTIPLPGDTSADAIAAILLDLATLAVKLDKPLTVRLLPIPGLKRGDETNFKFEYFTRARVMDIGASKLDLFDSNDRVEFKR